MKKSLSDRCGLAFRNTCMKSSRSADTCAGRPHRCSHHPEAQWARGTLTVAGSRRLTAAPAAPSDAPGPP